MFFVSFGRAQQPNCSLFCVALVSETTEKIDTQNLQQREEAGVQVSEFQYSELAQLIKASTTKDWAIKRPPFREQNLVYVDLLGKIRGFVESGISKEEMMFLVNRCFHENQLEDEGLRRILLANIQFLFEESGVD